ncbi:unnamed protein product [Lupinus luteus]|uniref:NADP-dependent oxidoreductase domain-containing protein n=1 Tax=Lupinus luteus TaxID=3873 RepID=A0AAV1XLU4_LUPLU
MSESLGLCFSQFTFNSNGTPTRRVIATPKYKHVRPFQCMVTETGEDNRRIAVKNGKDSLDICRVVNGMWQTSGGWGRIEKNSAVDAMLKYADAGLTTFDMADIYGPAEDLYGIFINRVRRERPPEFLEKMIDAWGGWSLFQGLLRTLKQVASKHGVSIATVAVKYILDQPAVAGSMVGVRLGLSEHIQDSNAIFSLVLDEEDVNSIRESTAKGKDLLKVIGDCGDEYRRA